MGILLFLAVHELFHCDVAFVHSIARIEGAVALLLLISLVMLSAVVGLIEKVHAQEGGVSPIRDGYCSWTNFFYTDLVLCFVKCKVNI